MERNNNLTVWLSQHLNTANSRTLRSCESWEQYLESAERWLAANGGLVDYYCPRTGERNTYNLQDIQSFIAARNIVVGVK